MKQASLVGLALLLALCGSSVAAPASEQFEIGRRIYREGVLPNGQPLLGTVHGDVVVTGARAACVNCHRRSGYGSLEGDQVVPPINARMLFQPRPLQGLRAGRERPAYDDATLVRALHDGVNPTGRSLQAPMPRYQLSASETQALIQYLRSLAADLPPGVTNQELHLATIITAAVPQQQRAALQGVLEKFIADKNADIQLRQRGSFGHSQIFREWRLHVWELHGEPASWGEQLERRYREQPVFAVLGGVGHGSWSAIHRSCERLELPCLLPNTDEPNFVEGDFYSIYFTRGIEQEADVLAQQLREQAQRAPLRVTQVYRAGDTGEIAATRMRRALAANARVQLNETPLAVGAEPDASFWTTTFSAHADAYVLWLSDRDLTSLASRTGADAAVLYVSGSLLTNAATALAAAVRAKTHVVQLHALPAVWQVQRAGLDNWLEAHGLTKIEERVQANTAVLASLFTVALAHIRDEDLSREYLIERLEHVESEAMVWPSLYPRFSLGAGQRVGSQGGYVAALRADGSLPRESPWIVPRQ